MEETVTISRTTYDKMKSRIQNLQSENRYLSQSDTGGMCKLTFSGAFGIQTVEYRETDEAVALINNQVISELEVAKETIKNKKRDINNLELKAAKDSRMFFGNMKPGNVKILFFCYIMIFLLYTVFMYRVFN